MKKVLTVLMAAGFVGGSAAYSFACSYHSASAEHNLTVAEVAPDKAEEAASTFDPDSLKIEKEKPAE
jgi:hypothetical protein